MMLLHCKSATLAWLSLLLASASAQLTFHAAFDKGDLLYLRDEEEKRRFTEMELRDSEQQQFRKERARIEAERAAAALRAAQARKDKQGRYKQGNITLHVKSFVVQAFSCSPIAALFVSSNAGCGPLLSCDLGFASLHLVMQSASKSQHQRSEDQAVKCTE